MRRIIALVALALALAMPASAQSVFADLQAARAQYGTPMSRAELGALLNAVALKHKDEGVGLEKKTGGDTCPQPVTNTPVSCDILRFPGNVGRDVLGDSDGRAVPQWGDAGPASALTFVAPVETGSTEPPPPPPPPPSGDAVTHDEMKAAIVQLHTTLWAEVDASLSEIRARLARLENGSGGGGTPPPAGDTLAVMREQLATSKAILELLKKTAAKFGVQ